AVAPRQQLDSERLAAPVLVRRDDDGCVTGRRSGEGDHSADPATRGHRATIVGRRRSRDDCGAMGRPDGISEGLSGAFVATRTGGDKSQEQYENWVSGNVHATNFECEQG